MHRLPLLRLLERYLRAHPDERAMVARIRSLVVRHDDCLLRTCGPGHVTASAWIVSASRDRFLLTHHAKLDRWLQLGGHVDGEPHVHLAALREAREESGMQRFAFFGDGSVPLPLDVDVHGIPAHKDEPEHEHHDVRFLLVAEPDQHIVVSGESKDVRWFSFEELGRVASDESVARLARKARALLRC
jgi:8-oxo-dGTP pyrophosphatase MutT (NUDIX family)